MRALRVVGLGDDGKVVICESDRGERFQIPADERLRAAARGDITRLGQIAIELESQMRPREIQSRIRAGESVEQVAAAAGVPAERVERFAYPVLLERSRTAELAQRAHPVREDGPDVQELGEVIARAFTARGQDYSAAAWDSWKGEDGKWVVQLSWTAGRSYNRAHWSFHPGAHGGTVTPLDDHSIDLLDPNPNRQLRTVRPVTELAAQALQVERPEPRTERVVQPVEPPVEEAVEHRQAVGEVSRHTTSEPEPRTEQDFVQDFELTDEPEQPAAAHSAPAAPPRQPVAPRDPEPRQYEPRQPARQPRQPAAPPRQPAADPVADRPAEPRPESRPEPRRAAAEEPRPEPRRAAAEPERPAAGAPAAEHRPAEPRQPEPAPEPTPEPTPEPAAQPRQPAATTPPEPKPEPAAAKEEPPKPPARRGKGKKARPTVPSWEDVLLGTRSNR
jgi:Protein of unknown function (DUF3071)